MSYSNRLDHLRAKAMVFPAFESREYVRDNGGRMNIQSEPGTGTTVTIRLPAIAMADGLISNDPATT
jgi:signal transduction histidine kinase